MYRTSLLKNSLSNPIFTSIFSFSNINSNQIHFFRPYEPTWNHVNPHTTAFLINFYSSWSKNKNFSVYTRENNIFKLKRKTHNKLINFICSPLLLMRVSILYLKNEKRERKNSEFNTRFTILAIHIYMNKLTNSSKKSASCLFNCPHYIVTTLFNETKTKIQSLFDHAHFEMK